MPTKSKAKPVEAEKVEKKPRVILIAAVAANDCIGDKGKLPWHIPDELALFKRITGTSPLICGRRTFESMPRSVWTTRAPCVLTKDVTSVNFDHIKLFTVSDDLNRLIEQAVQLSEDGRVFIIGGLSLYEAAFEGKVHVDEAIITHLTYSYVGDTFMPPLPSRLQPVEQLFEHKLFTTHRYEVTDE